APWTAPDLRRLLSACPPRPTGDPPGSSVKIVFFHQFFSTPKGSWGTRVYEFCRDWVEEGHEVTVVTSTFAKSDLTTTKKVERQVIDGIDVIVIDLNMDNRQSVLKRSWSFLSFALRSSWYAV